MTAPLAHTAIGANPIASTTGRIQRGGRPVATRKYAPAATAARTASRVRGVIVSFSSNNVPSTSQAMSAGLLTSRSMRRSAGLPRSRDAVATLPLDPLGQFGDPKLLGDVLGWRAPTQPPRHPELALRVRIFLLHPVQDRVDRLLQRGVELLDGSLRGQRSAYRHRDRNLVAQQLLWMVLGPDSMGAPDDHRNDRDLRLQGHPRRPGLELPEFVTATDGGLGMHPDEFALPQPLHGHRVRVVPHGAVHRDQPEVLDRIVDRLHVGHLGFDHEAQPSLAFLGGDRRTHPVQVAGVVERNQAAAPRGNVLEAFEVELGSVHRGDSRNNYLRQAEKRLCHVPLPSPIATDAGYGGRPSPPTLPPPRRPLFEPPRPTSVRRRPSGAAPSRRPGGVDTVAVPGAAVCSSIRVARHWWSRGLRQPARARPPPR